MVDGMDKYTIGALAVQRAIEGFVDPALSKERGLVVARPPLASSAQESGGTCEPTWTTRM